MQLNSGYLRIQSFEKCAVALGNLCYRYAGMEASINQLLMQIYGHPELTRAIIQETGVSLEGRLALLEKTASLVELPKIWFRWIEIVSKGIKKNILPVRNRLIHDEWYMDASDQWGQTDFRAPLNRLDQANPDKQIAPIARNIRTPTAIWTVVRDCKDAQADLSLLLHDYMRTNKLAPFRSSLPQLRGDRTPPYRARWGQAKP